jgi:hypothetical protein
LNHDAIFQEWKDTYYKASTALQYREMKLEDAANLIENNLILLGATAIEDKLQDQVSHLKYQELLVVVVELVVTVIAVGVVLVVVVASQPLPPLSLPQLLPWSPLPS